MEIAHKIILAEQQAAYRDPKLRVSYENVRVAYETHMIAGAEQGDFSERLLALVDGIAARKKAGWISPRPGKLRS